MTKILFFSARWCSACREMYPTMEKLAKEGYNVMFVDFQRDKELVKKYEVTSLPTIVVLRGDEEIARFVGKVTEETLRKAVVPNYDLW